MPSADAAHRDQTDQLIARGSLWSAALVAAFRATPRLLFLDRVWNPREARWRDVNVDAPTDEDLAVVYSDRALTTRLSATEPTASQVAVSSSSQPSLMAQMLEDLRLEPGLRVLEIGAGTGYNAALLAHVVGPVISLDVDREVLDGAQRHLARLPDRVVRLVHGDGRLGYPQAAPFDRIQGTAATDDLEPAWLAQLRPGGLVQAPLDLGPGLAWLVQGTVDAAGFVGGLTRAAYFMPLRDEGEVGRDRNGLAGTLPGPERLAHQPAPWAAWHEWRQSGEDFLPSLALFAWVQGLTLGHATMPDGRPGFGLGDLVRGEACWVGPHEWRYTGQGGLELGRRLWGGWLDLGGPRPQEWRLRAVPIGGRLPPESPARATFARRGRCCEQAWQLVEPRRRAEGV